MRRVKSGVCNWPPCVSTIGLKWIYLSYCYEHTKLRVVRVYFWRYGTGFWEIIFDAFWSCHFLSEFLSEQYFFEISRKCMSSIHVRVHTMYDIWCACDLYFFISVSKWVTFTSRIISSFISFNNSYKLFLHHFYCR